MVGLGGHSRRYFRAISSNTATRKRIQHDSDSRQLGVRPPVPGRDGHPLPALVRSHPARVIVHQHHLGWRNTTSEGEILVLARPHDEFQPSHECRWDEPAAGQCQQHIASVSLLDGGEHRYPSEPLVAEVQERAESGPGAATQAVVDQSALQVEREDLFSRRRNSSRARRICHSGGTGRSSSSSIVSGAAHTAQQHWAIAHRACIQKSRRVEADLARGR